MHQTPLRAKIHCLSDAMRGHLRPIIALVLLAVAVANSVRAATVSVSGTKVIIALGDTENITDLNTSTGAAVITVNTVGSANNTLVGTPTGVTVTNNTVVIGTAAFTSFTGFQVLGGHSGSGNTVTVGLL